MFRTLAYADVFDYPLTAQELKAWTIVGDYPRPILTAKTGNFYHLRSRFGIVALRQARQRLSRQKLVRARRAANLLKFIPWIKMVAVTGALAMNNSDRDDDIDLMVVTSANRLWLTRLLVIFLLFPRLRRRNHKLGLSDKLCLNLWLDETALTVPVQKRNLYTAHEVAQAKPILNRDHTYQKFIGANLWLRQFLPNWTG